MRPLAIAAACSVVALAIVSLPKIFTTKNTAVSKQKTAVGIHPKTNDAPALVAPVLQDSQLATIPGSAKKHGAAIALNKSHPDRNEFVYDPEKSGDFTGTQGTKISFSAHAFVDEITGMEVKGPVKVKLDEYYLLEDIIVHSLHTMSTGGLLETNGMVNVQAFSGDRRCRLKDGAAMSVKFPIHNNKPDMQLFFKTADTSKWELVADRISVNDMSNVDNNKNYAAANTTPTLTNGPIKGLRNYLNTAIDIPNNPSNRWNGTMEIEFCVNESGFPESLKVLKELNADATASIARALLNLKWKRGFKDGVPARYRATVLIEFKKSGRSIVGLDYTKPFAHAPYPKQTSNGFYYAFSSPLIGWLNCDRFVNYAGTTIFSVPKSLSDDAQVLMYFPDMRGLISPIEAETSYLFSDVPSNLPITIIAIKKNKGQLQAAFQYSNSSGGSISTLSFKDFTNAEFAKDISQRFSQSSTTAFR